MEKSSSPLTAGLSGAVLVALLAAPFSGGHTSGDGSLPGNGTALASLSSGRASDTPNFNSDGPWYAICREYLTKEPPFESQPNAHPRDTQPGMFVHVDPPSLDESVKEYSRETKDSKTHLKETQRSEVGKHYSDNLSDCTQKNSDFSVRVMIALVADPMASHLQLMTDRAIDAIGQGAATEDYNLTSYWMPWRTGGAEVSAAAAGTEAAQSRLQEPGVLIYRKRELKHPSLKKELLFVLLVGETPTSGVNRLQMARALRDAHEMISSNVSPKDCDQALAISGPNFSGTYDSLGEVLHAFPWTAKASNPACSTAPRKVVIVSPDTADYARIQWFRGLEIGAGVTLASLGLNNERTQQIAQIELERKLGLAEDEIAWLSEDETAFGSSQDESASLFDPSPDPSQDKRDTYDAEMKRKSRFDPYTLGRALRLKYPRDLSSLRNSTDPGALLLSPAELSGAPQSSPHALQLTLGDKSSGNLDSPPAFGANQEALRAEAALEALVERMHERRIQAIVVTASNPLDQLYLLDYFHRSMPDARLVTVDADEFMTQRPSHVSLIGTLVLAGLPLLPGEVTNRTDPKEAPMPIGLPSTSATGQYLATRLLLLDDKARSTALVGLTPEMEESSAQNERIDGIGKSSKEGLPVEAIGTFIVGRYGLEAMEGSNLLTHYPVGEPGIYIRATINPYPTAWVFVLGFLLILTAWHLAALQTDWQDGLWGLKRLAPYKWAYPPAPRMLSKPPSPESWDELEAYRSYYVYVACNQITLLQAACLSVTAILLFKFGFLSDEMLRMSLSAQFSRSSLWWTLGLFLANIPLFAGSLAQSLSRGLALGKGRPWLVDNAQNIVVMTHVFPVISAITWAAVLFRNPENTVAVAIRCASVMHGLSPFVPFAALLMGYLLWAWLNLQRISTACSKRVWVAPASCTGSGVFSANGPLTILHRNLHTELQNCVPVQDEKQMGVLGVWIIGMLVMGVWNATRGIDGFWFHFWTIAYGATMLLYACGLEVLCAFRRWWAFKALLDYLERSPIAAEFSPACIGTELASMRIWQIGGMPNTLQIQSRTLDKFGGESCARGQMLLRDWLNQYNEGLRAKAATTHFLSVVLNYKLAEHATILDMPDGRPGVGSRSQDAHYLTLRYIALIPYALVQIRNSLSFVVWGFAAAILCVGSYPFQGEHALGGFISVTCVVLLAAIAYLLVQIERHPLLSRLEGSDAGKASFLQVAGHLLSIGGLPLIAVMASQFPALGDFLVSWVKPVIEAGH